jgi:hypothetical protein
MVFVTVLKADGCYLPMANEKFLTLLKKLYVSGFHIADPKPAAK